MESLVLHERKFSGLTCQWCYHTHLKRENVVNKKFQLRCPKSHLYCWWYSFDWCCPWTYQYLLDWPLNHGGSVKINQNWNQIFINITHCYKTLFLSKNQKSNNYSLKCNVSSDFTKEPMQFHEIFSIIWIFGKIQIFGQKRKCLAQCVWHLKD